MNFVQGAMTIPFQVFLTADRDNLDLSIKNRACMALRDVVFNSVDKALWIKPLPVEYAYDHKVGDVPVDGGVILIRQRIAWMWADFKDAKPGDLVAMTNLAEPDEDHRPQPVLFDVDDGSVWVFEPVVAHFGVFVENEELPRESPDRYRNEVPHVEFAWKHEGVKAVDYQQARDLRNSSDFG